MATPTSSRTKTTTHKPKAHGQSSFGIWLILGSVLIVALGVGITILNNRTAAPTTSAQVDLPANWIQGKSMGNPEAKVTVQTWEDFRCPHCREWTTTVEPQLFNDYIKTGKVRLEFHLFPLNGFQPQSSIAGMAAECAADQNLFWPYHDRLFAAQDQGVEAYTQGGLTAIAKAAGLDEAKFTQCFSGLKHQATVNDSLQQATKLGLTGTPSLLINGKLMNSPFDYAALKAAIDPLLK